MPRNNRRTRHLRVPVTPEEAERIERLAAATGLGIAAYLRAVGQAEVPYTLLDQGRVDALTRAMADLGRLGGLLKLWLSDDDKLAAYPAHQVRRAIPDTLFRIRDSQGALLQLIQSLQP